MTELDEAVARLAALPPPEPDPRDAEIARMREVLRFTLMSLEYWYRRSNPDWNGEAGAGSTIGDARALVADQCQGEQ